MIAKACGLLALVVFALVLPYHVNLYWIHVTDVAIIYGILALGLALTMGIAGQVNLAQVAFFGTGAYTSAVLTTHGFAFWVAAVLAVLLTTVVSIAVSVPALRVQSHYLGIVTLGLALAFTNIATNASITGQADGLNNLAVPPLGGLDLADDYIFYYVVLAALGLGLAWATFVVQTRLGRRLRAMRDDSLAAAAVGAETPYLRMTAFVLGGLFGGVAGVLYAGLIRFVSPESFSLSSMFFLLAGVIIGGRFSLLGSVFGAILLVFLREELSNYSIYAQLLYGGLVVLIVVFAPTGLVGIPGRLWKFASGAGRLAPLTRLRRDAVEAGGHLSARPYLAKRALDEPEIRASADQPMALQVKSLTKRFRGLTALEDVDISVSAGEIRGIVGPNGSGKTTLFNVISGLYTPSAGKVQVCGTETTGARSYRLAQRGVARTFQNVRLFGRLSVRDNVLIALDSTRTVWAWRYVLRPLNVIRSDAALRSQANALLSLYGLSDVAGSLPGVLSYG
ncbi:MAG: ABC transporter permease subunit, partial [Acidothermaceae bacterium]